MSNRPYPNTKQGRDGGYYPRQSAPRTPPTKPTPPPTTKIREGALSDGELSPLQRWFGKRRA